jgi:hypothetical protein
MASMENNETSQRSINEHLYWGIFFAFTWLGGVGSFYAVRHGLKARRLIKESAGQLKGIRKAWICILVGGYGLIFWGGYLAFWIGRYIAHH